MITKVLFLPAGLPPKQFEVELPARPGLRELDRILRPLLDGGTPEHVVVYLGEVAWLGERAYRDMFVDEEGREALMQLAPDGVTVTRTRPGKNLPRNEGATELYLRNERLHKPHAPEDPDYFIAGPAVLFPNRRVWF